MAFKNIGYVNKNGSNLLFVPLLNQTAIQILLRSDFLLVFKKGKFNVKNKTGKF